MEKEGVKVNVDINMMATKEFQLSKDAEEAIEGMTELIRKVIKTDFEFQSKEKSPKEESPKEKNIYDVFEKMRNDLLRKKKEKESGLQDIMKTIIEKRAEYLEAKIKEITGDGNLPGKETSTIRKGKKKKYTKSDMLSFGAFIFGQCGVITFKSMRERLRDWKGNDNDN